MFLAALDQLTEQRRHVSNSDRAGNWAPKVIIEAGYAQGVSRKDLSAAMNRLLAAGILRANADLWRNNNRHWFTGLQHVRQGS